jgi:hypothetical protein
VAERQTPSAHHRLIPSTHRLRTPRAQPRWTRRTRSRRLLAVGLACACLIAGCGNTLQSQPLTSASLEPLETTEHYPVYWLGARFEGLALTSVSSDPSGAFALQYGNCARGGPETCVAPLQLVSSPDNSFLPGVAGHPAGASIRGVRGVRLQGGEVIEIATGPAVVDVRAENPRLALLAVREMVPINELGRPGESLPKAQPNTGFAQRPMEGQRLNLLRGLP